MVSHLNELFTRYDKIGIPPRVAMSGLVSFVVQVVPKELMKEFYKSFEEEQKEKTG